jgi:hypothetical protein
MSGFMPRRQGSAPAPAPFDFTAGGLIPAANCLQSLDALAAASNLAASLLDIGPHGNDATSPTPPGIAKTGWLFDGTTQYIDSGIVMTVGAFSMVLTVVAHTYVGTSRRVCGVTDLDTDTPFFITTRYGSTNFNHWYQYGNASSYGTATGETGVFALVSDANPGGIAYHNGVADASIGGLFYETPFSTIYIGATNYADSPYRFASCSIGRWALYDIALDATQVAALSAVMAVA